MKGKNRGTISSRAFNSPSRSASRIFGSVVRRCACLVVAESRERLCSVCASCRQRIAHSAHRWTRLLSHRRCRGVSFTCDCAAGHAPGRESEQVFSRVEDTIRQVVPPNDLALVLDNIGIPQSVNLAFSDNSTISSADGEILVSLKPGHRGSTPSYMKTLREKLAANFPDLSFYFQPADIVSQILNFGLPAPIDIQVAGYARKPNYAIAREIETRVKKIPGAVDVGFHQVTNAPEMLVKVDRTRAQELGFTERDIANSLLISLSGTGQITPNYWVDPKTGINYPVAIQTPQHLVDSVDALLSTSLAGKDQEHSQLLSNVVSLERAETPAVVSHTNVQPVFDIYANVQGADLGRVSTSGQPNRKRFSPEASARQHDQRARPGRKHEHRV